MSLRYQISLRILFISIIILFLGGSIAIWQARNAVNNEVDSSINLALQLIKLSVGINHSTNMGIAKKTQPAKEKNTLPGKLNETDWIYRLSNLEQTRHLIIQLKEPSGSIINITNNQHSAEQDDSPPFWFINLVTSHYPKAEYQIETFDNHFLTLIIQANPLDEITEVWHESIAFFSTLVILVLLTFLSVHLVFNKTLKAIQTIVSNLQGIEKGEYDQKLPDFNTQEYDSIAKAVNHMADVLKTTRQQNQALTQHSLEIQEEERQHLSQELHDEFGQSLTAIKVMAVTAAHEKSDTQKITASIIDICDHLMTVLRSMMKQLHPLILTELGLKATLDDLLIQWQSRSPDTTFTLQVDEAVDNIDKTIVIQIFRVIQESLTNIIRHANASYVSISLEINSQSDILELIIDDNGQGCELNNLNTGFGLQGMTERVKLLNGTFKLQSQPGQGMQVKAKIPLNEK